MPRYSAEHLINWRLLQAGSVLHLLGTLGAAAGGLRDWLPPDITAERIVLVGSTCFLLQGRSLACESLHRDALPGKLVHQSATAVSS
jgi:hypothetical protein